MFKDLPNEIQIEVINQNPKLKRVNKLAQKTYLYNQLCELPISEKEFERHKIDGWLFVIAKGEINNDFHMFQYVNNIYTHFKVLKVVQSGPKEFRIIWDEEEINYYDLEIIKVWYDLDIIKELYKLRPQCKDINFSAGQQLKDIVTDLNYDTDIENAMNYLRIIKYLAWNYEELAFYNDNFNYYLQQEIEFKFDGAAYNKAKFNRYQKYLVDNYKLMLEEIGIKL